MFNITPHEQKAKSILKKEGKVIRSTITTGTLLFLLFVGLHAEIKSQPSKAPISLGLEQSSSGNGHGLYYNPTIAISKGLACYSAALMVQHRSGTMNGWSLKYARMLSGESEKEFIGKKELQENLLFSWFVYSEYIHQSPLCKSVIKTEYRIKREITHDWEKVNLNTWESGAGVEMHVGIKKFGYWKNYIATSLYHHFNYIKGMDHPRTAISILIGTGLFITL